MTRGSESVIIRLMKQVYFLSDGPVLEILHMSINDGTSLGEGVNDF